MHVHQFTVIVPAYNEEAYLAATLDAIHAAAERLTARGPNADVVTIVVDNNSRDGTSAVSHVRKGARRWFCEPVQSISRARNAGARHATGDVIVFIDADVIVPYRSSPYAIHLAMSDSTVHRRRCRRRLPTSTSRCSGLSWRVADLRGAPPGWFKGPCNSVAGASSSRQGGYDESVWIGEDVDFNWKLNRAGKVDGRDGQIR